METCIVADSQALVALDGEGKSTGLLPSGFLSFFILPRPSDPKSWAPPPADLYVLPIDFYLDLPEGERPCPVYAYGQVRLMAEAFRQGAADCLRNPWGVDELEARALRLLQQRIRLAGVIIAFSGSCLVSDVGRIALTDSEMRLGRLLAMNLNRAVPRKAISLALWGCEKASSRATDMHISSLRKKLEAAAPGGGRALLACRKQGYRLLGEPCG